MSPLVFRWELIWRNRSLTVKQHLDPSLDTLYLRVSWNFVLCHSFPPLILFLPSEAIFQMDEHPLSYKRLFHLFHPYPLMSVLHLVEHQVLQNALPFKTRSNTWALPSESHTWYALEVHTTILSVFHRPSLPSIGELNIEGWGEENLKYILHIPMSLNHFPLNYLSTNETPSLGFWGQGLSMESSLLPWSSLLA